jgi:putative ABC transport system permease protein
MVMVMLSGTLSLYLGTAEVIEKQYPGDINVRVVYNPDGESWGGDDEEPGEPFNPARMLEVQTGFVEGQGYKVLDTRTCLELGFGAGVLPDGSYTTDRFTEGTKGIVTITCITEDTYTAGTGEVLNLGPEETAAYGVKGETFTIHWTVPKGEELGQTTLQVVHTLKDNPIYSPMITDMVTLVVPDEAVLHELWARQAEVYGDDRSSINWYAYIDLENASEADLSALQETYGDYVYFPDEFYAGTGTWLSSSWELKSDGEADAYGMAGGFLFLGIFLGFIFLMATVLIIYYKQISEGYEDKERFEIMQKVGLSRGEVKRSIHSQILMVFFLPIVVASIHIVFDFNMVEKLLTLFYLHDTALTALCTLGTVLVFFAVYGAVYLMTAKTYYKIVER